MLVLNQVALSLQVPLTIISLLLPIGDRRVMGDYASGMVERVLDITPGVMVVALNALLLYRTFGGSL